MMAEILQKEVAANNLSVGKTELGCTQLMWIAFVGDPMDPSKRTIGGYWRRTPYIVNERLRKLMRTMRRCFHGARSL